MGKLSENHFNWIIGILWTWNPIRLRKRLQRVLAASRRMRKKYRERMAQLELGWRQRMWRHDMAIAQKEGEIQELMHRHMTFRVKYVGDRRTVGAIVYLDQEYLFHMIRPGDQEMMIRYACEHLAGAFERELRTVNWARIDEVKMVNERERIIPSWPSRMIEWPSCHGHGGE